LSTETNQQQEKFVGLMAAGLPFNAGLLAGRAAGLPVLLPGYLLYAITAFSRKFKKSVRSAYRFVLSLVFSISMFLFSLVALEAAKEADYDLREIVPLRVRHALSAASDTISTALNHSWTVAILTHVEGTKSLISNAIVAALLVPLFTHGIRAFLSTLWWFICFFPNMLRGFLWGFGGSFEYAFCAVSLTNHHKHPGW
jgi:hypothetical protein